MTVPHDSVTKPSEKTLYDTVLEQTSTPIADSIDTESISERKAASNPFADPEVAEFYRALYESTEYECRHEFDPDFKWTEQEEKAVVRKLDWRVSLFAVF